MGAEYIVELVDFTCAGCGRHWTHWYEVRHCETVGGNVQEYFRDHGMLVMPPYSLDGAPHCRECGRWVVGRQLDSRSAPVSDFSEEPDEAAA
jgi:hypothetical protein